MRKRAEGLEVRVLYDGIGSLKTSGALFDEMRNAGIEVLAFRPLNPVQTPFLWKINNRDHRKIVVVDGTLGFTGGVNVSGTYAQSSGSSSGGAKALKAGWRDTHVQIEGPAVAQLQALFLASWTRAGGNIEATRHSDYFPELKERGSDLVTIIANDGDDTENRAVYACEIASIDHAVKSILFTQAYFAPNAELVEALVRAKKRGVDVRIIVPGFTDSALIFHASRATYVGLLKGGIKLYEDTKSLLHAKTAVIDGVVSTVGSANFDMRSFIHNNEANAVIVSRPFGRALEQAFEHDLEQTREITLHEWQQRPLLDRLQEKFSSMWSYWL
jgi:cardiolipin synthase